MSRILHGTDLEALHVSRRFDRTDIVCKVAITVLGDRQATNAGLFEEGLA